MHRDVKPSNILLADNDFAYLIDFGIARAAGDTALTSEGSTIGTWAYMAPERFRAGEIEPSSDIYALACVLYECLTGERPFPGSTLERVAMGHLLEPPPRPSEKSNTLPARNGPGDRNRAGEEDHGSIPHRRRNGRRGTTGDHRPDRPTPHRSNTTDSGEPHQPKLARHPQARRTRRRAMPRTACPRLRPRSSARPICRCHRHRPSRSVPGRRHGVLVGAAVFVATLLVAGGVIALVGVHSARQFGCPAHQTRRAPVRPISPAPIVPTTGRGPISRTSRSRMLLRRRAVGPSARRVAPADAWRRRRTSVTAALPCCRI